MMICKLYSKYSVENAAKRALTGKVVLDGSSEELKADEDIPAFYLGMGEDKQSFRDVKHYRRRKRWLS